jgi:CubicO group peptidase (beta-lactamase class C family)
MKVLIIVCLFFYFEPAKAQTNIQRLDSLFNAVKKDPDMHFNGTVLVADHGKIIYKNSAGYADIIKKRINTDTTRFSLASLSKVFTCVAIMQLKDKGKLKLDDKLVTYLPDFPYSEITIRQLLSHTSGLPDFIDIFPRENRKPLTNADIIPALKNSGKTAGRPGEKWSYSSPAFGLLAMMVEKLSGLSFTAYFSQNICRPAGMLHSYINSPYHPVKDAGRAVLYPEPPPGISINPVDTVRKNLSNPFQTIIGPGLVVSTAQDLLRFDQALYSNKLLSAASVEEMFTPVKLTNGKNAQLNTAPLYAGMDWAIDIDSSAGKVVSHNGGNPGISAILLRNLRTHQTVILLENTDNPAIFAFGVNAMNLLNHKPLLPPMRKP